jgi:hypothetical protein
MLISAFACLLLSPFYPFSPLFISLLRFLFKHSYLLYLFYFLISPVLSYYFTYFSSSSSYFLNSLSFAFFAVILRRYQCPDYMTSNG